MSPMLCKKTIYKIVIGQYNSRKVAQIRATRLCISLEPLIL